MKSFHTNFQLNSQSDFLTLSTNEGIEDSCTIPSLDKDISYARVPDTKGKWQINQTPTPGYKNVGSIYPGKTEAPEFSCPGGIVTPFQLTFSHNSAESKIYFTIDGSEPTELSKRYTNPILIDTTRVIRARAYKKGKLPSDIISCSYILNENSQFPIVSLITDPYNFWDRNYGIYVIGTTKEGNFFQDWERPIHVELIIGGKVNLAQDAGVKIHGNKSRMFSQKSLSLFARSKYGPSSFQYPIFPDLDVDSFESLILHNSGNDWYSTMFRDGLFKWLIKNDLKVDMPAFRPAICYINGSYWGIQNIREKINGNYFATYHDIDPNQIDLIEFQSNPDIKVHSGTIDGYQSMIEFIETHPLSNNSNYEVIQNQIDIDSYIDYNITEIFIDNYDWPGNNQKFWRSNNPPGKWRWVLYDLDHGFNFDNVTGWDRNSLSAATTDKGKPWPNPPYSTFLFRNLLSNEKFKRQFINRFADLLNTTFCTERTLQYIDSLATIYATEIKRHHERWSQSAKTWDEDIESMREFARHRVDCVRSIIVKQFNLAGQYQLTMDMANSQKGHIKINSICPAQLPWTGTYFADIPITLQAIPTPGFKFVQWSDGNTSSIRTLSFSDDCSISAKFEAQKDFSQTILINEINYNSSDEWPTGDWVELYNPAETTVDLSGWIFQDNKNTHSFRLPENTYIEPDSFIVLVNSCEKFCSCWQKSLYMIGNFEFELSAKGDHLRLLYPDGSIADSVTYDDAPPWPTKADGKGATLVRVSSNLQDLTERKWYASAEFGGSPGSRSQLAPDTSGTFSLTPFKLNLFPNFPNPFNHETKITYYLPASTKVTITIFDTRGRRIKSWGFHSQEQGYHTLKWDGKNDSGIEGASGMYFIQLYAQNNYKTTKALLIK